MKKNLNIFETAGVKIKLRTDNRESSKKLVKKIKEMVDSGIFNGAKEDHGKNI